MPLSPLFIDSFFNSNISANVFFKINLCAILRLMPHILDYVLTPYKRVSWLEAKRMWQRMTSVIYNREHLFAFVSHRFTSFSFVEIIKRLHQINHTSATRDNELRIHFIGCSFKAYSKYTTVRVCQIPLCTMCLHFVRR